MPPSDAESLLFVGDRFNMQGGLNDPEAMPSYEQRVPAIEGFNHLVNSPYDSQQGCNG